VVNIVDVRQLTAIGALIITTAAGGGAACGEPSTSPSGRTIVSALLRVEDPLPMPSVAILQDDFGELADEPTPAPLGPELPLLTTSATDREPTDLRLLLADAERWRLVEFKAAATWRPLATKVMAFGQVPYVLSEWPERAPALDETQELASLGIKGEAGDFEAGAHYRSVGKRLDRLVRAPTTLKDREGHEIWIAQRLGLLKLRLSDSDLSDNVDRNPALPRTTRDQTAVTAELSLTAWPVLGLTYAAGESARSRLTPEGREDSPERHQFESVTGSAYYYGGPGWDVSTSSTLALSRHLTRPEDEMATLQQDLSLTLHLRDSFTVAPTLSVGLEHYAPSDVRSDTSTAGIALSYAPPAGRWWASTFVGYTSTRTSDGSTDARNVSLTGALTCALNRVFPTRATLSFEAGYDHYADSVVPDSAARAVSGFVVLRIAAF
jgi:hypothetical protein